MFYAVYKLSSQLPLLNISPTKWLFKNISPWIYFLGFILKYNLCYKSAQYSECVLLKKLIQVTKLSSLVGRLKLQVH